MQSRLDPPQRGVNHYLFVWRINLWYTDERCRQCNQFAPFSHFSEQALTSLSLEVNVPQCVLLARGGRVSPLAPRARARRVPRSSADSTRRWRAIRWTSVSIVKSPLLFVYTYFGFDYMASRIYCRSCGVLYLYVWSLKRLILWIGSAVLVYVLNGD